MKETSSLSGAPAPPAGGRARATYEALLEAGERSLGQHGYSGATSTLVAAEAGVATGTFYTYFRDKDALLAALLRRRLDELMAGVEAVLSSDRLLDEGLASVLTAAVDVVRSGYRRHSAVFRIAVARIPEDTMLRRIYWERHDRAVQTVRRFLRRGATAGLTRSDESGAVSTTLVVLMQSLNHPAVEAPGPRQGVRGELREVRDEFVGVLYALLAPRR